MYKSKLYLLLLAFFSSKITFLNQTTHYVGHYISVNRCMWTGDSRITRSSDYANLLLKQNYKVTDFTILINLVLNECSIIYATKIAPSYSSQHHVYWNCDRNNIYGTWEWNVTGLGQKAAVLRDAKLITF